MMSNIDKLNFKRNEQSTLMKKLQQYKNNETGIDMLNRSTIKQFNFSDISNA